MGKLKVSWMLEEEDMLAGDKHVLIGPVVADYMQR